MKTPYGDDAVDDSSYNDPLLDEDMICDAEGHDFNILDGRCAHCGAHAPPPPRG